MVAEEEEDAHNITSDAHNVTVDNFSQTSNTKRENENRILTSVRQDILDVLS